ncbi:MAG: rod shape-determining protein MreC [Oscillospiraceae bacterium]|nr:rod shape-determining protein MreC [Oscillospiraceae bacterium]
MKDFFGTTKFKILVAVMAVIVGVMIFSLTQGGYTTDSASVFGYIFEPFQKFSTGISNRVTSTLDMLFNAEKYYNENIELKNTLNEIYNDIIDYDIIARENEQLRVMLELKEEYDDYVFSAPCTVIARTTNDPYHSFTIDKGSDDGVSPYDPVITSSGLVGVCYDVSRSTSKVRTLYSPKTAVGVTAVRSKATGIIEGDYEFAENGQCRMNYISKTSDIEEGDIIITSGSETFPANQLIGTVESVGMEDSGLSKYAIINLAINPDDVSTVFVITSFNGQGGTER